MEAIKIGRRRAHDLDCEDYRQMKRRVSGDLHIVLLTGFLHYRPLFYPPSLFLSVATHETRGFCSPGSLDFTLLTHSDNVSLP
ncbi:unnamed protein product [Schistocephalus solidus]|uniref:Uncharacterized protein n=1 Tax=Schistocephalus solidus TaxID=70667 RepID=A0A183SGK2_SCHSO|nr:unnamed protein product [Schistocephalus solidus]